MANNLTTIRPAPLPTAENPASSLLSNPWHERLTAVSAVAAAQELATESPSEVDQGLLRYRQTAERLLRPAGPTEIAKMLARLAVHYHQAEQSEGASDSRWADWVDDLSGLPIDVIEAACAKWRRSPARFMPSPGQLLEQTEKIMAARRAYLRRVELVQQELEFIRSQGAA